MTKDDRPTVRELRIKAVMEVMRANPACDSMHQAQAEVLAERIVDKLFTDHTLDNVRVG